MGAEHLRPTMRLPALFALGVLVALTPIAPARADEGDVLVQAGHEGRPQSCAVYHVQACRLGAAAGRFRELDWTPIVADEATRVLRAAGYTVLRRPADWDGGDSVRAAVFIHFDGATPTCTSGASVGFPETTSRAFVDAWERRYLAWFPFRFRGENFTENEHRYYGFRKVDAPEKLLVEMGELSCPEQRVWMETRLRAMGDQIAAFLEERVLK
ncbi:MAG: hypothetical protein JOZ24_10110 [Candidatus Eremiobacteraeota bacterium]|nr:hypothetical protein [Candidatus Eremiobacteraeota bacterium]